MKNLALFIVASLLITCFGNKISLSSDNYTRAGSVALNQLSAMAQSETSSLETSLFSLGKPIKHTESLEKCLALPQCKEDPSARKTKKKSNLLLDYLTSSLLLVKFSTLLTMKRIMDQDYLKTRTKKMLNLKNPPKLLS